MALTIEQAIAAGALAKAIEARQDKITQIQQAIDGGWVISRFAAVGPDENEVTLVLDRLDPVTSAQALRFALSIYQAQLEALTAQLSAIG